MRTTFTVMGLGLIASAALLGLAGCGQLFPHAEVPAPSAPEPAAPASSASATDASAAAAATAALVQAAAIPPSPASAPVANPTGVPAVSSMKLAEPPHKLGAPVDLRYQFDGDVKTGQPVTLHLAAVPHVAGSNLTVSIKKESGISATARELRVQKAGASTPYRQEISITKLAGAPSELHVLVMMEMPEGSAHSWFNIPFDGATAAGKLQPNKLE